MSEIAPETQAKLKRKNSPQVALRRKLFRVVLLALLLLIVIFTWKTIDSTVFDGDTAPVLDYVEFRREYAEDGELTIHMDIHFHDLEGDIDNVGIELFEASKNFGVWGHRDVDASPGQQRSGAMISSWFTCTGYPMKVDIRVVDIMGNQSISIQERIPCFASWEVPMQWIIEG